MLIVALTHACTQFLPPRTWQFIARFEKEERDRRQEEEEAALRNRVTVAATTVGLLMAIVATLGVTICWVRVRRVALLYEVRLGTPPFKPATPTHTTTHQKLQVG